MSLSIEQWSRRYKEQARWTQDLRYHLYARLGLKTARSILDVGCGTGVLLPELHAQSEGNIFGLDIDHARLLFAQQEAPYARMVQGDAHALPFKEGAFDITLCHYLLLWVRDPAMVVREMRRVTAPGGVVLALAEPDYGARIDYPPELARLGFWQREALRVQGADPDMGRKLKAIFSQAGLEDVEAGVLGGQWTGTPSEQAIESEWEVLEADLKDTPIDLLVGGKLPGGPLEEEQREEFLEMELGRLWRVEQQAYEQGSRILYVPTFYAWGRSPIP